MRENTHIFDLHCEDIMVSRVLPHLTLRDCFNFRCVSKTCLQTANLYLTKLKCLKVMNKVFFSPNTCKVISVICTRLHIINLSRCTTLKDTDLIPLLSQNPQIVSLNLSHSKNLSAKCLQPVILHCNNLKVLKLARCSWLTTGAVEALALHQSQLEDVDFSFCNIISENCIRIFIRKFIYLKTFNLEGDKQVTDRCLYTMSRCSATLKMLNLGGCTEITDKGINALSTKCQLEGLVVRGCGKVTENSLGPIRDRVHIDRRLVEPVPMPVYLQI